MIQMSAQQRFASVRARLMELELWDADSLVMTAPGAVCSAAGKPVEAALFSAVSAPMAVFTAGRYAREEVRLGAAIPRASFRTAALS